MFDYSEYSDWFKYLEYSDWYKGAYIDKKAPVKAGRSFSLVHNAPKSNKAVFCIHGYTGYPGELTRPAVDLFKIGFDVYVPRLPGHGTSGDDFLHTTEKDWISVSINAVRYLVSQYDSVYVIGHSMGGAIATVVASEVKEVKRLVLAAPALAFDKKTLPANPNLVKFLSIFRHRIKKLWQPNPEYVMYYEDAPADDLYLGHEYWSWQYPKQLCALFRLMLVAGKKALGQISCPTLVICAELDNVVGSANSDLVLERLGGKAKRVDVENGTHYLFYDKDKKAEEKAVKAVIDFFLGN